MNTVEDNIRILGITRFEYIERLRAGYPVLIAYEVDDKPLRTIAAEFGKTYGQIVHRLAKERGAYIQLTGQRPEEIATWHGTARGYTDHDCDCTDCTEAYETAKEQQREAKKERDRNRDREDLDREAQWKDQGIIVSVPGTLCGKAMSKGRTCGKPVGHKGQHLSAEAVKKFGKDYQTEYRKTDKYQATKRSDRWQRAYGIIGMTVELFDELMAQQGNRCAICDRHASEFEKRLSVDHDHSITDRFNVRGLLCQRCNNGMSYIDYGWALPTPAITAYLERFAVIA